MTCSQDKMFYLRLVLPGAWWHSRHFSPVSVLTGGAREDNRLRIRRHLPRMSGRPALSSLEYVPTGCCTCIAWPHEQQKCQTNNKCQKHLTLPFLDSFTPSSFPGFNSLPELLLSSVLIPVPIASLLRSLSVISLRFEGSRFRSG